jgi:hypothetical protein
MMTTIRGNDVQATDGKSPQLVPVFNGMTTGAGQEKIMSYTGQQLSDFVHETHGALLTMAKIILDLQERYKTDATIPGRSPWCKRCANRTKSSYGRFACCANARNPVLSLKGCTQFLGHKEIAKAAKEARTDRPCSIVHVRVSKRMGKINGFERTLLSIDSADRLNIGEVRKALWEHFDEPK